MPDYSTSLSSQNCLTALIQGSLLEHLSWASSRCCLSQVSLTPDYGNVSYIFSAFTWIISNELFPLQGYLGNVPLFQAVLSFLFWLFFPFYFDYSLISFWSHKPKAHFNSAIPDLDWLVLRQPRIKSVLIQQLLKQQRLLSKCQINCGCWNKKLSFIRVCLGEIGTASRQCGASNRAEPCKMGPRRLFLAELWSESLA